ncbi:MAG: glucose-6-phosphate isomerase, partial [Pseudomonadales bacterium]|nr:glucose-6-phosphate isomerase [Pseudomonadales bacterium]
GRQPDIGGLFAGDPERARAWQFSAAGITLDLCRSAIDHSALNRILDYAKSQSLEEKIQQLLTGDPLNNTERRAAHHSALRAIFNGAEHEHAQVARQTFDRVCAVATQLHDGSWRGALGKPIRDVINIGIGGSDLGPRLVCDALDHGQAQAGPVPTLHFVSNIDPVELDRILNHCQPATTLVIIASKTFGTLETLQNARAARQWLLRDVPEKDLGKHLLGISANTAKACEFGIEADNVFPLWDWVGGRYSLWSAIGLSIAIAHGADHFEQLLRGAHAMDQHFGSAALAQNLPVLLAANDLLNINALGARSIAVLPYCHQLKLLPDYLQQLCMESNGKRVTQDGEIVQHATCPVIWGSSGTVGQHSFHQLLHQGTENIPVDFILPLRPNHASAFNDDARHRQLVANCLAQSKALTEGKNAAQALAELRAAGIDQAEAERLAPHKVIPGNRPHNILAMQQLNATTLGALIALYEHRVFVQSVFWSINAFDQWGVELGKQLGGPIDTAMRDAAERPGAAIAKTDAVTARWISAYQQANID